LRAKVGQVVGYLAGYFELEVDEGLSSIIPDDEGGFLEQVLK
jgi:ABC-type dipeptide/oligopeptide/nickel transport system permease subunit